MSCLVLDSASAEVLQTGWKKGVTQGAVFKISQSDQEKINLKICDNINLVKKDLLEWIDKANQTHTNIDKIIQELLWTLKDVSEVAEQPHQISIVNLQREQTIIQLQCCRIIRKVTKKLIKDSLSLANKKIDKEDIFLKNQLNEISVYFFNFFKQNKKVIEVDIENEKRSSLKLRRMLLKELNFLLSNPTLYKAILLKKTAFLEIQSIYERLLQLSNLPSQLAERINIENRYVLEELKDLDMSDHQEFSLNCYALVKKATKTSDNILFALNLSWRRGNCGQYNI